MNIEQQLAAYKEQKATKSTSLKRILVVAIDLGIEPRSYFPKLKGADGKTLKDEDGRDLRSDTPTGTTYSFAEYGTGRMVKVVLTTTETLTPLTPYEVSGYGYDIKGSGGLYFIEKEGTITEL